jgi:hypothetical protein
LRLLIEPGEAMIERKGETKPPAVELLRWLVNMLLAEKSKIRGFCFQADDRNRAVQDARLAGGTDFESERQRIGHPTR